MLLKLIKYIKGYVKIKVEGYSPERFLNLCNVHKIVVWDIENKGLAYELYVSVNDYKKMRPLVKKTRTKIILLEKHGLPFFLFRFRKRKMFFVGMSLCITGIYILSLFVWNIHFEGNVKQSTGELLSYLETLGVSHGSLKSNIICEEIETKLRNQYPNMLWVSAEMRGTRIMIQIKENTDEDIVSNITIKEEAPCSIIAEFSGTVESIIVRKGTPLVKKGDQVEKGQILVEGFYGIINDSGEITRYEGVAADADIEILVTENYQENFSVKYDVKHYTERKRLGIKWNIGKRNCKLIPKIPFENYESITKKIKIHITENFYLPFSIDFVWYLEYLPQKENYSADELKIQAEKRFNKKYENILQKGVQIIEKDVKIDTNGELCHVAGTVSLLVPVTKKVPAVIPELLDDASLEGEH